MSETDYATSRDLLDGWVHDDDSPCPEYLARDVDPTVLRWWCTTHEQYVKRPACPPSAVRDLIVQWFEVQEGDLVLFGGRLHQLVQMWPTLNGLLPGQVGIRLLYEGKTLDHCADSNAWTAVRRYEEG